MKDRNFEIVYNKNSGIENINQRDIEYVNLESAKEARRFHRGFSEYEPTPLWQLSNLANSLGIRDIYLKDESFRFGLNAFKVMGGAFAVGKYVAELLGVDINGISFDDIKSKISDITFVTATDGNHGRGIAWAARMLGQKAVVFMPKGSVEYRLESIRKEGAMAEITDMNYDETVRYAEEYAKKHNGVIIQDTAWDGYEDIPKWIMQGYTTIIDEVYEELDNKELPNPTHIFLQAGVGSFAASMLGYVTSKFGRDKPFTIIVEPDEAACIFKSAKIADGRPHVVDGDMPTIMAGLACGEPNPLGWTILRDYADAYISCRDEVTAEGMRVLGKPTGKDQRIVAGESGAVGIGLLKAICNEDAGSTAEVIKLNKTSVVLVISTEGDTDPVNYRKILDNK